MTLLELANFICGKVNQSETEDVLACKGFLQRRHDLVWQEALWKDALVEYRQTLDADVADYVSTSNYLPTKGVLLLPPIVQRVIAARTTSRKLNIQRPEFFYRIDYDAFAKTGEAADYILLPPCVWEFNTALEVFAARGDVADAAVQVTSDLLDTDGVGVTRSAVTLAEQRNAIGTTERIDAIQKPTTTAAVGIFALGANLYDGRAYDESSPPDRISVTVVVGATYYHSRGTDDYAGIPAFLSYDRSIGTLIPEGYFVATEATVWLYNRFTPIPTTTATLKQCYTFSTAAAADTNAKRRQRIRLVEIPTTETTIRVLGKRTAPQFSADTDEPGISGMENCLIAFGLADMLERDESYGEAREKFQEAMELLEQLKRIETVQQAHNQRITPEGGYGDDFGGCAPGSWMQ